MNPRGSGMIGWILALALLAGAGGSRADSGVSVLPEFDQCRFLVGGVGSERPQPLDPERLETLFGILEQTGIGAMVAAHLRRYRLEGTGPDGGSLEFFEVAREGGPAAAYFETGQLHLNASLLAGLDAADREARNRSYTAASFLVHEGIHAIAHHLYLTGRFPIYRSDTKVNEALAYFVQGLYLDEVREREPDYREVEAVPAWDVCTTQIVRILTRLGVTRDTPLDDVYDLLAEMQLEADDTTAVRVARLWQYYQFIVDSDETNRLWALAETDPRPLAVVRSLTRMIATDVERRHCNFDRTFEFMTNRIILYAHYPDTPPGVPGCQYFVDFVQALREDDETSVVLREQIDRWLQEREREASRRAVP
ncbi:hypothetical protein TVNIR_1632 [Thioalkalivibrio nitratireducens DSM 14787]|uniref:Uncharacterized protein n=2 Tax=Thioalkalivibrio nitratireducens TaxID=186931 RepID=L0DW94_THIND|nr:hypothetical protein TVNIR_1632 [Thioalkalivibrio nitratireducens DSM 14787]